MNPKLFAVTLLSATSGLPAQDQAGGTFLEPVRILAQGEPIDVDAGHAAPYVVDWNGDGKRDLLVGQFGEGKLRIYLGEGDSDSMEFGEFAWFEAGGKVATTPAG